MIDKTRYAIVQRAAFTASGYDEVQCRTILKKDATRILRDFEPNHRWRRTQFTIVLLPVSADD